jgi:hypothetical protein
MSCNKNSVFAKISDASDALADINKMLDTNLDGGARKRVSKTGSKKRTKRSSKKSSKQKGGNHDDDDYEDHDEMSGGARKRSSKTGSKKKTKRSSKKSSKQKGGSHDEDEDEEEEMVGGKRKRTSKSKVSKKSSKKKSKKQSGGREMNPKMKSALAIAKAMKTELNLKGGPAAMGTAFKLLAKYGTESKAIDAVKSNKSEIIKMYNDAQKNIDSNRAAKKASKKD